MPQELVIILSIISLSKKKYLGNYIYEDTSNLFSNKWQMYCCIISVHCTLMSFDKGLFNYPTGRLFILRLDERLLSSSKKASQMHVFFVHRNNAFSHGTP